ncbi:MAG: formate/nitrite transporter family protein [Treponema sp.]|jgi:formate/nitrite transporter|nr:formate/nitrite transporter family protein [Treponema sp.]
MEARTPMEILAYTSDVGLVKAQRKIPSLLILAVFAGAFISFAAEGSSMAAHNLLSNPDMYGLGRALTGYVFAVGLMMVMLTGGELFTGNNLIIVAVLDRRVTVKQMLINWFFAYIGNFAGCLLVAWLMVHSRLLNTSGGLLGGMTIKIAADKTALTFGSAFLLGLLCNWLVCIAVWVSYGAKDVVSKAVTIFFIIGLFVVSGFEHSIANMYYIPAGILAKADPVWLAKSGLAAEKLASLNWGTFFTKNLIPVTLGNIFGGVVMVGVLFWLALRKKKKPEDTK